MYNIFNFVFRRRQIKSQRKSLVNRRWDEKKRKISIKFIIFGAVILLIVIIGALFFLQNKYLIIKNISVHRLDSNNDNNYLILEQEIKDKISRECNNRFLYFFRTNTLLTFNRDKTIKKILNDGRIQGITIELRWPNQLIVNFIEKKPIARLTMMGDKDYFLDYLGQIIEPADDVLPLLSLPVVYDKTNLKWQSAPIKEAVNLATSLFQRSVQLNNLIFNHLEFNTDSGILTIKAQTNQGWFIYFLADASIKEQIQRLKLVLEQQLANDKIENIQYIDLRFGDKIYYQ